MCVCRVEKRKTADPAIPLVLGTVPHVDFLVWRAGTYPGDYEARFKPQFHQLVAL